jgi:leucyl-tRNA---protein transferase
MDDIQFFQSFFQFNEPEINEHFYAEHLALREWQKLLANGWRHNGQMVYRTSRDFNDADGSVLHVLPLRYRLKNFNMSKGQRKIWRQNQDLTFRIIPLSITDEIHALFTQHTGRFKSRVPDSIFDFVSSVPRSPFQSYQMEVRKGEKLIAVTFIDLTRHTLSSTYAAFDLAESKRSLGVFTMLLEIEVAIEMKKTYHYPGYAYREPSSMDYKKRFAGVEYFDWWNDWWLPLTAASL